MVDISEILVAQGELEEKFASDDVDDKRRQDLILDHIKTLEHKTSLIIPEFSKDAQWINSSRSLSLQEDLKGKIVVLDFFTYCCINCVHILPDLRHLEDQYSIESGVVVVGVHSAKFDNEKILENVVSAVLRNDIRHPVVNDPNGEMWEKLSIFCWPTLLILGPKGQVLFVLVGESSRNKLITYVKACTDYFMDMGQISNHALPIHILTSGVTTTALRFPGKVACCPEDNHLLAIADTGHHRIVIISSEGLIMEVIGGPYAGFANGNFQDAKFHSPQGIAWKSSDTLFIADTDNHAIRQLHLPTKSVTTLAGNGQQGNDCEGGGFGIKQIISSPWDICTASTLDDANQNLLLIAMAGIHQLWGYALEDLTLLNGKILPKGQCLSLAGTGKEENRNNNYPHKASFAQPSGICLAQHSSSEDFCIALADSESSTIRMISVRTFAVKGVVGGGHDPLDLFKYGDVDGIGFNAKLQHPLGVAWNSNEEVLYVADSYNHKIKKVNLLSRKCETYAGMGNCGNSMGSLQQDATFNEPGGISISNDNKMLYVADTNNHSIKVINLHQDIVSELPIRCLEQAVVQIAGDVHDGTKKKVTKKPHVTVEHAPVYASAGGNIVVHFILTFQEGLKINQEAHSYWRLYILRNSAETDFVNSGTVSIENSGCLCNILLPEDAFEDNSDYSLALECTIYFCDTAGLCHMRTILFLSKMYNFDKLEFDELDSEITDFSKTVIKYDLSLT